MGNENNEENLTVDLAEEAAAAMAEAMGEAEATQETEEPQAQEPASEPATEEAPEAEQAATPEVPETQDAPQEEADTAPEEPEQDTIGLPSMNAEERAQFEALTPEAQAAASAFLERREKDMVRHFKSKTKDAAALQTDFGPVAQMFEPFREQLKQTGMSPFVYIKNLADMDRFATQDPLGYMEHVAKSLNVDKQQLAQRLGLTSEENDWFSPENPQQQAQPQQQPNPAQPQPAAQSPEVLEVQAFASEMVDGVILHPHFQAVANDMAALAEFNPDDDLGALYTKACQLHGLVNPARPSSPVNQQAAGFAAAKQKVARAQTASKVASSAPATPEAPNFDEMSTDQIFEHFVTHGQ